MPSFVSGVVGFNLCDGNLKGGCIVISAGLDSIIGRDGGLFCMSLTFPEGC